MRCFFGCREVVFIPVCGEVVGSALVEVTGCEAGGGTEVLLPGDGAWGTDGAGRAVSDGPNAVIAIGPDAGRTLLFA